MRSLHFNISLFSSSSFWIHFLVFIYSKHLQTHVIFPHLAVSNSAEYFPEPQRFMPERWIKRGELGMHKNLRYFVLVCQKLTGFFCFNFYIDWRRCLKLSTCGPKNPSVCQFAVWLWSSNVHRTSVCRKWSTYFGGQGSMRNKTIGYWVTKQKCLSSFLFFLSLFLHYSSSESIKLNITMVNWHIKWIQHIFRNNH